MQTTLAPGETRYESDGEKGLKVLESNRIDLALVDLNMPHMNGEEMIQRTKQNPATANIPILVVSTESSETRIDRIRSHGADFLHKPFTPEILRPAVRELTGVSNEEFDGTDSLRYSGPDF